MAARESRFSHSYLVDTTPLPPNIPHVDEVGASSAPLLSAAFFIGARCQAYNDDYMKCKTESNGNGEMDCLREGRKVTRCATSVLKDINTHCLDLFRLHWNCLEENNHRLFECRVPEQLLNKCVFDNLKLEKVIPGAPEGETPIHLKGRMKFASSHLGQLKSLRRVDRSLWVIEKDQPGSEPAKAVDGSPQ